MKKLIGYYNYTVILTYIGLCSGVIGIIETMEYRKPFIGVICLLFSGLCDAFDGKIASSRQRNEDEKAFGTQIDSLSDIVCFGVLPAIICYTSGADSLLCVLILTLYVLCGLIRLAYYNVSEASRQKREDEPRREYLGLPITVSAIVIPAVYILSEFMNDVAEYIGWLFAAAALLLAVAFVIPFKVKKLMKKGLIAVVILGVIFATALFIINFA